MIAKVITKYRVVPDEPISFDKYGKRMRIDFCEVNVLDGSLGAEVLVFAHYVNKNGERRKNAYTMEVYSWEPEVEAAKHFARIEVKAHLALSSVAV